MQQAEGLSFLVKDVSLVPPPSFDGTYQGVGIVSENWQCLGNSYFVSLSVQQDSFEAIVTREGGARAGSQFSVVCSIDCA